MNLLISSFTTIALVQPLFIPVLVLWECHLIQSPRASELDVGKSNVRLLFGPLGLLGFFRITPETITIKKFFHSPYIPFTLRKLLVESLHVISSCDWRLFLTNDKQSRSRTQLHVITLFFEQNFLHRIRL